MKHQMKAEMVEKLTKWAANPTLKVSRALAVLMQNRGTLKVSNYGLLLDHKKISKAPLTMINNLCTDSGNAYGRVLTVEGDYVSVLPEYRDLVASLWAGRAA